MGLLPTTENHTKADQRILADISVVIPRKPVTNRNSAVIRILVSCKYWLRITEAVVGSSPTRGASFSTRYLGRASMRFSPGSSFQLRPPYSKLPVSVPGSFTLASSAAPFLTYSTVMVPSGCGYVACSLGNEPRWGAMRTVLKPGLRSEE